MYQSITPSWLVQEQKLAHDKNAFLKNSLSSHEKYSNLATELPEDLIGT